MSFASQKSRFESLLSGDAKELVMENLVLLCLLTIQLSFESPAASLMAEMGVQIPVSRRTREG